MTASTIEFVNILRHVNIRLFLTFILFCQGCYKREKKTIKKTIISVLFAK